MAKTRFNLANWLIRAVTENVGLKLFSLVISVLLFSFYGGRGGAEGAGESQRTFFVDVTRSIPGDEHILVSEFPPRVRVTLQGSGYLLSSVDARELLVDIDLSDPTQKFYYFSPNDIQGEPSGVTVADIEPQSLALRWDERVSRSLPVHVSLEGELREGLQLVEPVTVLPAEVGLEGARGSIPTGEVSTELVDISDLEPGRHERRLQLEPPSTHVHYVNINAVDVILEVVPALRERVFDGLEVVAIGPLGRVRPRKVKVTVQGAPSLVDGLRSDAVIPWVDATGEGLEGTTPQPVQIRGLPGGVSVVAIEPSEVLLTVTNR